MTDSAANADDLLLSSVGGLTEHARTREEIVTEICMAVADGAVLTDICGPYRPPDYPSRWTFYLWKAQNPEFAKQYDEARVMRVEKHVEETFAIADDGRNDWMDKNDPNNPGYLFNGEHSSRSKLRVSQRNWYAERIVPHIYAPSLALGGNKNMPPIKQEMRITPGTPEEIYRQLLTGGTLAAPTDGSEMV